MSQPLQVNIVKPRPPQSRTCLGDFAAPREFALVFHVELNTRSAYHCHGNARTAANDLWAHPAGPEASRPLLTTLPCHLASGRYRRDAPLHSRYFCTPTVYLDVSNNPPTLSNAAMIRAKSLLGSHPCIIQSPTRTVSLSTVQSLASHVLR